MGPHARKARHDVLQVRVLDLEARFARPGLFGKDAQDKTRPVKDFAAQLLRQVPELHGRERFIEDDEAALRFRERRLEFRKFSAADIGRFLRRFRVLRQRRRDLDAERFRKERQLRECALEGLFRFACVKPREDRPRGGKI